jgi:hypothetical protein
MSEGIFDTNKKQITTHQEKLRDESNDTNPSLAHVGYCST